MDDLELLIAQGEVRPDGGKAGRLDRRVGVHILLLPHGY